MATNLTAQGAPEPTPVRLPLPNWSWQLKECDLIREYGDKHWLAGWHAAKAEAELADRQARQAAPEAPREPMDVAKMVWSLKQMLSYHIGPQDTYSAACILIESIARAATQAKAAAPEADMRAVCEALGFDPTNHHNAAKCPYCRPSAAEPVPVEAVSEDSKRLDAK